MSISIENAKRLKELGVEGKGFIPNIYETWEDAQALHNPIPQLSLSQLLDEVEKRRHFWTMGVGSGGYWCDTQPVLEKEITTGDYQLTKEDAVAAALIEMVEGKE